MRTTVLSKVYGHNKKWHLYVDSCKNTFASKTAQKSSLHLQTRNLDYKGYVLLIFPAATFGLGCWQIQRRQWKLNLIETITQRTTSEPIPLPYDLGEIESLEYTPVKVRGRFLNDEELYIGPRQLLNRPPSSKSRFKPPPDVQQRILRQQKTAPEVSGVLSDHRKTGAQVVTPFKLADRDETILINRGWVPTQYVDPETRKLGQIEGEVEVVGLVRRPEREPWVHRVVQGKKLKGEDTLRGPFRGVPLDKVFHHRDTEAMAVRCSGGDLVADDGSSSKDNTALDQVTGARLQVAPVMLDLAADYGLPVSIPAPVPGQTRVQLRNTHLEYIFTWFSLSGISLFLWYRHYFKPIF